MAVKRYVKRYVKTYSYVDEATGESEDIVFMANGYLFPLFKSLAGVELTDALENYHKGLLGIVTEDNLKALFKFQEAPDADAKLAVAEENQDAIISMLSAASKVQHYGEAGLDFIELVLICTRVCAMPENERAEALGIGTEILPAEVYQDPAFAFEILQLVSDYDQDAKKNLKVRRSFVAPTSKP